MFPGRKELQGLNLAFCPIQFSSSSHHHTQYLFVLSGTGKTRTIATFLACRITMNESVCIRICAPQNVAVQQLVAATVAKRQQPNLPASLSPSGHRRRHRRQLPQRQTTPKRIPSLEPPTPTSTTVWGHKIHKGCQAFGARWLHHRSTLLVRIQRVSTRAHLCNIAKSPYHLCNDKLRQGHPFKGPQLPTRYPGYR